MGFYLLMGYTNSSLYSDGWQVWSNAGLPYIDKNGNTVHYDSAAKTVTAYTASK
ncbi:MAG: hypothetical protein LKE44_02190 [Eubacterium sp.]|jgi:thiosulfate/3-mercaptopyruvate sulfurtransferase|nr:hypothetical protein [Eubacterium sp.]